MSRIKLSILLILLSVSSVQSQNWVINGIKVTQDSVVDMKGCIDFINEVNNQVLSNDQLTVGNDPNIFNPLNCFDKILQYDYYLKKEEWRNVLDKQIPELYLWSLQFQSASSKRTVSLKANSKAQPISWPYFYLKKSKKGSESGIVNYYSLPIFLRSNEQSRYCIYYSIIDCGFNCGSGEFSIYINNNARWVKIKNYCAWID